MKSGADREKVKFLEMRKLDYDKVFELFSL
jgi:hypothetical protein